MFAPLKAGAHLANERLNAARDTAVLARATALLLVDVVKSRCWELDFVPGCEWNSDTKSAAG